MLMDEGVDTGAILSQCRVAIEPRDNTESLTGKLAQASAQLLEETLPQWFSGALVPRRQEEAGASYTVLFAKKDGEIDWHLSAVAIWRRVRAFYPWPGCHTRWQGRVLKVIEATPLPGGGEPGRVMALALAEGAPLGVETGDGILGLLRVQLEGKKAMAAEEFLRGHRTFLGTTLPTLQ